MKINTNILLWIAVVVLAMLYLRSCNDSLHDDPVVLTKTDSLYIKGKPDTVFHVDTLVKIEYLTSTVVETIHDTITGDSIFVYNTPFSDSLIEGTITNKVKGLILSTNFEYTPKFPKYITRVDTLQISDSTTVTIKKNKWALYVGGIASGNATSFEFSPTITLKTNKSLQFTAGYGLINKTYNIGVHTVIPNPFKK